MGVICILLGIIAFIAFTGAGAILGNAFIDQYATLSMTLTALKANAPSNTTIMIGFVGVFGFIGLLICVSMVTTGLTYGKVAKLNRRLRRKD